ncbi:MAG TPA: hypothetical protein VF066_06500 [Thermoleophilaceae bacterium]
MRGGRAGIGVLLVAAAVAGCGSGDEQQPGLTSAQARAVVAQLEAARAAAAARDVAGTEAAVGKFRQSVARLRRGGALSDATAHSLRTGAARLLERVRGDNAPAAQPAPAPETTPAAAPPGQKKHEKKKHGKDGGHGKGEEGDG